MTRNSFISWRVFMRIALRMLLLLGVLSCSNIANQHKSISPDDEFISSMEALNLLRRCEAAGISACSKIAIGGSAANGSFAFNDLYTTCTESDDGLAITLKNDDDSATFQMGISFYGELPTKQTYACVGPEYAETTPTHILKDSYCTVQAQVHNTTFSANDQEICTLKITATAPFAGTIECTQLTTGRFNVSLDKTSRFSCPSATEQDFGSPKKSRPAFVQVEVNIAGTEAQAELPAKVVAYEMNVSGCESGFDKTFSYKVKGDPKLLNLKEGDTGCVAKLTSFVYSSDLETEETFEPIDGSPLTGAQGTRKTYVNEDGSKELTVSVGSTLRETLLHNELISFYVRPPFSALGELFYSSTGDFTAAGETAPQVTIASFKDLGEQGGERDAELIVDCTQPVMLSLCGSQNVLDYRARIIDKAALTPTQVELAAAMQDINTQLRPTVAHLYANGLRFLVSFNATDAATKEYILIVQHGNSYRYFIFSRELFM